MMEAYKRGDARFQEILTREASDFNDYIRNGTTTVDRMIAALKEKGLDIDRYIIGGSIGKGTSPGRAYKPDFDVYIFFNVADKSDTGIERAIPQLLKTVSNKFGYRSYLSGLGLTCRVKNEFCCEVIDTRSNLYFDLIAAVNLGEGDDQWKEVLDRHGRAGRCLEYLNSSLIEKTIGNVKKQDQFVKDAIKLAKIWNNKCLHWNLYINGRSAIVELIAIKAVQDETAAMGRSGRSLTSVFVRFLEYLKKSRLDLTIWFDDMDLPRVAKAKLESQKEKRGVLIDPANPYQDFFDHWSMRRWG